MPCLRQMSEIVSPLARSRSASRSNRATSSAFLRLLMGPSRTYSTRRLPFRLDQFLGGNPVPGFADCVSDAQLAAALCASLPLWSPPPVPSLMHELRLWGRSCMFTKELVGE